MSGKRLLPNNPERKRARGAGLLLPAAVVAAVAAGAHALVTRVFDLHVVHAASGLVWVYTIRDAAGRRVRVIRSGGVYESATYVGEGRLEPVFAYYRALARVFELAPRINKLLVIGGGGCSFSKLVALERPQVRQDVVEIDPAVVAAAHRWFYVDEAAAAAKAAGGSLNLVCADGRAFLDACEPGSYDAVVMDAFVGSEPAWPLATVEAARAARRALAPGGVYAANVVSEEGGCNVEFLRCQLACLSQVFAHVVVAAATDEEHAAEDNYLVVASDAPISLPDQIAFDEDFLASPLFDADLA